jgi:multiple sugar transport system ATP-binding protein
MVFQHYALYPHMSVRENMAFGLRNARVPKDEIERRVADAARVLEIEELLDEAGGRCRAASASGSRSAGRSSSSRSCSCSTSRCRTSTRRCGCAPGSSSRSLKQRVDAAVIMVTHDQAEAMTLADRIVVMNDRRIQQVGPPMEIYSRPATPSSPSSSARRR